MTLVGVILVAAAALALMVAYRLLARPAVAADDDAFTPRCPGCGYDLRVPAQRCPECGAQVPEYLLFRARLMAGELPEWMEPGAAALPLRVPEESELWRQVGAASDLREARVVQTLLDRAGIASRSRLSLWPERTDFLAPGDVDPLFGVIDVPETDWLTARELVIYVTRRGREGSLDSLETALAIETDHTEAP